MASDRNTIRGIEGARLPKAARQGARRSRTTGGMGDAERPCDEEQAPLIVSTLESLEAAYRNKPGKLHTARILRAIYASPGITRKSLVSTCKMRPGTVTEIVARLVGDNLVHEVRPEIPLERGRPEIALHIDKRRWLVVVIFCVSTEMQAVLVNSFEEVISSASAEIPALSDNADFEQCIVRLVTTLVAGNPYPKESRILGVSLSVPGIVDSVHKTWVFAARWPKMRNLVLADVQERLGIEVSIRRQLDVRLNYEMVRKPALKSGNTLLFYWGYGIGGAFASHGEIIGSQTGVFCQIGHIAINPDSVKPCLCGRLGCLESEAAYWALQPDIARLYSDIVDNNEYQAAGFLRDHAILDQDFFKKAQKSVAYALSYLQAILVPDRVLLSGMFLENPTVQDSLVKRMRQLSPPFVADMAKIEFIEVSNAWNAGAIAFFHFRRALEDYIGESSSERPSRGEERDARTLPTASAAAPSTQRAR